MERIKLAHNFYLDEFLPAEVHDIFKERGKYLIRDELISCVQLIRDLSGVPIEVNNWWYGGAREFRGWRPIETSYGAPASFHKLGMAGDICSNHMTPKELKDMILHHNDAFYELGLRRIEDPDYTTTWLHIDLAPTYGKPLIKIFKP